MTDDGDDTHELPRASRSDERRAQQFSDRPGRDTGAAADQQHPQPAAHRTAPREQAERDPHRDQTERGERGRSESDGALARSVPRKKGIERDRRAAGEGEERGAGRAERRA